MHFLASLPSRRRSAFAVLALAVAAVAVLLALPTPTPGQSRSSLGLDSSWQSVQVERALAAEQTDTTQVAVVVVSRPDGAALSADDLVAAGGAVAEAAGATLGGLPGGTQGRGQAQAPPGGAGPQVSEDGTAALFVVGLPGDLDVLGTAEAVGTLRDGLAGAQTGLTTEVTGAPAFLADLGAVFEGANVRLLIVTVGVVALILAVTYRSPLLVLVPLVVVAAAEQTVLRLVELLFPRLGLVDDGGTAGIVSILVFGAATNYALLLIARYREQLRVTQDPRQAIRVAVARAGGAILASGLTVVLAVLALLLSQVQGTQALGAGAAIGVLVALLAGLVVLPCALVVLGRAAFWPFVPRVGSVGREGRLWTRLGGWAARRPRAVAAGGSLLLVALALPTLGIQVGLTQAEQFREAPEAVLGAETVAEAFSAGALDPAVVLAPPARVEAVTAAVAEVDGVVEIRPGEAVGQRARLDVVLDGEPRSTEAEQAVRDLRGAVKAAGGPDAVVGGSVAADLDRSDAEARDRATVIPVILAAILLVLVLLLRSLVAPVLLLLSVVGTYFASLGVSWVLFRTVFDFPGIEVPVLLLGFVFLVALGVDYSIFLTTRAREEAAAHGTVAGMLTALRVTGGVITSAGLLLAAVFATLAVLPLVLLTQLGVIVAVGVLLDTLLVRTLLVPALAVSLGGRFWWPARVDPEPAVPAVTPAADAPPAHQGAALPRAVR